jgi:DNA-binding XRE family transcriptional regulator
MSKCVEWEGPRLKAGYGSLWHPVTKLKTLAHRYAWEKARGPIPKGMCVCHHCDNPPCIRLSHLFIGSRSDNMLDASRKGRMKQCFKPGEAAPNVKLTQAEVSKIRALRGKYLQRELAARFGVTKKTICRIQLGESWSHSL